MPAWTRMRVPFTSLDEIAYPNPALVDEQFRLPPPRPERVFSSALVDGVRSTKHALGRNQRTNNLGNLLAIRLFKQEDPECWIWDERCYFWDSGLGEDKFPARRAFIELLGPERLRQIQERAREVGLQTRAHSKGRPDVGSYSGRDQRWRFAEVKIVGRKSKDVLNEDQKRWLSVIADVLGPESAIELEFYPGA